MKLSFKLTKLADKIGYKFWSKAQKDKFDPIFEYCTKLENEKKVLEQELRQLRQVSLLEPRPDPYNGGSTTLPKEEIIKYNKDEHCASMLDAHGIDGEHTKAFMKRREMSTEEFLERAKRWKDSLKNGTEY